MSNDQIRTGHEIEVAEIERFQSSVERQQLTVTMGVREAREHIATLHAAALGTLAPCQTIFGERSAAEQVEDALLGLSRILESFERLAK